MEITQIPWGLTPEGEAVVVYTLAGASGASVQLTNLGAALVSAAVPDRAGALVDVVHDSAPVLAGRVWDSRIEGNRVIFSTTHSVAVPVASDTATLALEAAYHWSEECELELLFSAVSDADTPVPVDFVPRTRFGLASGDRLLTVDGWKKNILAEAGSVTDPVTGIEMRVLTSLPRILVCGAGASHPLPPDVSADPPASVASAETILPGEHYIQKIVYRFGLI